MVKILTLADQKQPAGGDREQRSTQDTGCAVDTGHIREGHGSPIQFSLIHGRREGLLGPTQAVAFVDGRRQ